MKEPCEMMSWIYNFKSKCWLRAKKIASRCRKHLDSVWKEPGELLVHLLTNLMGAGDMGLNSGQSTWRHGFDPWAQTGAAPQQTARANPEVSTCNPKQMKWFPSNVHPSYLSLIPVIAFKWELQVLSFYICVILGSLHNLIDISTKNECNAALNPSITC